jgi:hypothetical protein
MTTLLGNKVEFKWT